ncbi:MAG: hypothetical protein V4754_14690 [Pseudomonadota bacterium]
MARPAYCRWGKALAGLPLLACCALAQAAAPSTFGTVVGNAVLCLDHVDNAYFHAYLVSAFGPSYKREGGAYWFKSDATLWGAKITDVIVSDDSSDWTFVGLVADTTPEILDPSIVAASGVHYVRMDRSAFPVRESSPGSKIVYFNSKSKVYCARYKALPPPIR